MKKVIVFISLLVFGGFIFIAYANLSALTKQDKADHKSTAAPSTYCPGFSGLYSYKVIVVNFLRH
jgi:uncharacterized alpha/beta hydrolase family protein